MNTNREKAADILAAAGAYCGQCCFGECGEPDCPRDADWRTCPDCASVVNGYARRLAEAGLLAPDVDPDRVHTSGRITIIETGSDRTSVTARGGVVTIVDEVAGVLADHSPELAAENAMTIEEVEGMIAALTHARTIAAHAQKEETNE